MARHLTFAMLVLAAVIVAPVGAQDGKKYTLEEKDGGWEVEELLKMLGAMPDCTIQFDPHAPQIARKKIEFKGGVELDRDGFFNWVRALLFKQRLVLVPVGPAEAHTWAAMDLNSSQITSRPVHVAEENLLEWADRDGVYITTVITLKHIPDTARVRNALAQLCTRQVGRINDVPATRSFAIADFAPVVVSMYRLVKTMEAEAAKTPPAALAAMDKNIQRYEKYLATCQTEVAAKYFITRIEALTPKGDAK